MRNSRHRPAALAYIPKSVSELDDAFAQISADLAQQYILSYYPAADKRDGRFHINRREREDAGRMPACARAKDLW